MVATTYQCDYCQISLQFRVIGSPPHEGISHSTGCPGKIWVKREDA